MKQKLAEYILSLELGNRKPATVKIYTEDITRFIEFFGLVTVEDLRNLQTADYYRFYESLLRTDKRPNNPLAPKSLNRIIRSISAFLHFLKETDNSFFSVRLGNSRFVKETKVKRLVLTPEEEEMILATARDAQETFMLKLLMKSAIRRDAISNIKVSDIEGCTITIRNKGGNKEYVYLNDELCEMLNEYMKERESKSEYLFYGTRGAESSGGRLSGVSVNKRIKWCAAHSGMAPERAAKVTTHTLRRTTITNVAIKHGKYAAQKVARHSSPATTDLYINDGDEIARRIMLEN